MCAVEISKQFAPPLLFSKLWHLAATISLTWLQDLYEKAGLEGERIVFLLKDTQITHEAFLEVGPLLHSSPCRT